MNPFWHNLPVHRPHLGREIVDCLSKFQGIRRQELHQALLDKHRGRPGCATWGVRVVRASEWHTLADKSLKKLPTNALDDIIKNCAGITTVLQRYAFKLVLLYVPPHR
eukprot:Blabericola_migrator_1__6275@NODE_3166_length_1985_cov_51_137122_g1983_i0_p3_GENE_NODE_3166_length_1985_cov_51_137122_g1983_i0NODE_3166_length_1985_cov_51_137122_g1983_i0_p3_ORF_typecomplete_len108_score1_33_NODE_3166_length_1985_cov_51_137122_g1983_i0240563